MSKKHETMAEHLARLRKEHGLAETDPAKATRTLQARHISDEPTTAHTAQETIILNNYGIPPPFSRGKWKLAVVQCPACGVTSVLEHQSRDEYKDSTVVFDCKKGSVGSNIWVNLETKQACCDKCEVIMPLYENTIRCVYCGHTYKPQFLDIVIKIERDEVTIFNANGEKIRVKALGQDDDEVKQALALLHKPDSQLLLPPRTGDSR